MTRLAATACLLVALRAWTATPAEALRTSYQAARQAVQALRAQALEERNQLSAVSARIEVLKGQSQGALLPGGELDRSLKRSQELSTSLTSLAQQLSSREAEAERAARELAAALTQELERLQGLLSTASDRAQQRSAARSLHQLRQELRGLAQALPAGTVPANLTLTPSEDPVELLRQADLLRDNQEKVQRELKAVETALAERRAEAALERRLRRFAAEEAGFDEQDRRLRLSRNAQLTDQFGALQPSRSAAPPQDLQPGAETAGGNEGPRANFGNPTPSGGIGTTPPPGQPAFQDKASSLPPPSAAPPAGAVSASDARPQVGGQRELSPEDIDIEGLETLQRRLARQASDLEARARALEAQARQD